MDKDTNNEIPKWDAALYETPEGSRGNAAGYEIPELKNLNTIAIALRGIEAQLNQLNKELRRRPLK